MTPLSATLSFLQNRLAAAWTLAKALGRYLRAHWKLSLLIAVIGVPLLAAVVFALSPKRVEYVTEPAVREDLVQTVEANGTVTSDRDIALKFPAVSGVVDGVLVKEGDRVKAGQRLATLRASGLGASVASAVASLQAQQAQLSLMRQGSRPEDIAVTEAELQNKRAALTAAQTTLQTATETLSASQLKLDALRREVDVSLAADVAATPGTIAKQLSGAQSALQTIAEVFNKTDVQDAIYRRSVAGADQSVVTARDRADAALRAAMTAVPADVDAAIAALSAANGALGQASTALQLAASLVSSLTESSAYTYSEREADKADLIAAQNTVQTAVSAIDTALSALRSGSAAYQTQIAAEEASLQTARNTRDKAQADILTYEASVRIGEAQLQLKRAGNRPEDIAAQEARVRQAQAEVARASAAYNDTILVAPIDGKITKVNIKKGEYTPADAAVTMLGDSPYRIEMYVSEIDIPKVHLTQSGSIELDAFRGNPFALTVSEIDPAATDRDGVPKYRVVLDFAAPADDLKIGMTGDADIVTGTRENVVTVPSRAVLERDDGTSYVRILTDDGPEERTVTTGLDGRDGEIEVDGVEEGEVVIVLEKQ